VAELAAVSVARRSAAPHSDHARAETVIETDDEIDALNRRVLNQLRNAMVADPTGIGAGTQPVLVSRSRE
jgi:hypothetical protein